MSLAPALPLRGGDRKRLGDLTRLPSVPSGLATVGGYPRRFRRKMSSRTSELTSSPLTLNGPRYRHLLTRCGEVRRRDVPLVLHYLNPSA